MKTAKKIFCLAWLFSISLFSNAQWIASLVVSPANPTTTDTIHVYAACNFPSGTCDEHTQTIFYFSNEISASALHCIGILTYICSATDTFVIPPLAAGTYNFKFHLDAGGLPSPCTPGIAPGPTDSVQFVVTTSTSGIPPEKLLSNHFNLIPDANPGYFILKFPSGKTPLKPVTVSIYSATGAKVKTTQDITDGIKIDLTDLNSGIYFARINNVSGQTGIKIVIGPAHGIAK